MSLLNDVWEYGASHGNELLSALGDHISILATSLGIALFICLPLGVLASRSDRLSKLLMDLIDGVSVIPSLAVLFLVVPYLGLNDRSAIFALTILAMPPVFLNTTVAFREIAPDVLEAALGMGMTSRQVFWRVKVPLAMPIVLTGVRTAAVEVTASATLAAFVGSGGFGIYITRGFAQYDTAILLVGAIPVALLTLVIENLLTFTKKVVSPPIN
ncbi:MAG: ABC transporter permease [Anaerolineales bacterium]